MQGCLTSPGQVEKGLRKELGFELLSLKNRRRKGKTTTQNKERDFILSGQNEEQR